MVWSLKWRILSLISLGRFIQPCLCRGSMAYIHVGCLEKWRRMSTLRCFYQCDQCGYHYKLCRAKVAGLAENKMVLGCVRVSDYVLTNSGADELGFLRHLVY